MRRFYPKALRTYFRFLWRHCFVILGKIRVLVAKIPVLFRPLKTKTGIIVLSSLGVLLLITILITPLLIRSHLVALLLSRGADQATIADIDFNPFTGYFNIDSVVTHKNGTEELRINRIEGVISWFKLLQGDITLTDLLIEGTHLRFHTQGERFMIAGLSDFRKKNDRQSTLERQWSIHNARVRNLHLVGYVDGTALPPVRIDEFNLGQLDSSLQREPGKLQIRGRYKSNPYLLEAELKLFQTHPQISLRLTLQELQLKVLSPFLSKAQLTMRGTAFISQRLLITHQEATRWNFSHEGEVKLSNAEIQNSQFKATSWKIELKHRAEQLVDIDHLQFNPHHTIELTASDPHLLVHKKNSLFQLKNLRMRGLVKIPQNLKPESPVFKGEISADEFATNDRLSDIDLFRIFGIRLKNVELFSDLGISTQLVTSEKVNFVQTSRPTTAWVDQFNERLIQATGLSIRKLHWSPVLGLSADRIEIKNPTIYLFRDTTKWPFLHLARVVIRNLKPKFPKLRIGKIAISGLGTVHLHDHSLKQPFKARLTIKQFELTNLSSRRPEQKTKITMEARLDNYTTLSLYGYLQPYTPKTNLSLNARIRELVLSRYSLYFATYYGYNITSGHLDLDTQLIIKNSQLSGEHQLKFTHLGLRRVRAEDQPRAMPEFRLPLELFVKLLANSRNEIKTKISNSGNLDDPKFRWGAQISQSLEGSLKRGAEVTIRYTQPVGRAFTLFQTAGKIFTNRKFQPLLFEVGKTKFSGSPQQELQKAADLLVRKPKVTLRICSFYTRRDVFFFDPSLTTVSTNSRAHKLAQQLSQKRAELVKQQMIKDYRIDSGRLFICEPKLDTNEENALPRVEFRL